MPKRNIQIGILVAVVLVATIFNIHTISETAGGLAIWNQNEAYIFMQVDRTGDSSSYLLFPWVLFKEYVIGGFAGAVIPTDTRAFFVVLHVTPARVENHVLKLADRANGGAGSDPERFTPLEGSIYAMCPGLHVCRWADDHFENVTPEEQNKLGGLNGPTRGDFDSGAGGWSRRGFGAIPADRTFTINVGNQFSLLVNNVGAEDTDGATLSIDLQRPGREPERIAVFQRRQANVSRAEYLHAFHDPE